MVDKGPKFIPGKHDFNPGNIHTLNLNDPRFGDKIAITTSRMVWFVVIGQIQQAIRHPENQGSSATVAKGFALKLAEKLSDDLGLTKADWERLSWNELRQ